MPGTNGQCVLCNTLPPGDLIELDLILADPLRWPVTVWQGFPPPEGGLPAKYRHFGAENMGREWLLANGYDINRRMLRKHIRYDVPVLNVDVDELVQRGLIGLSNPDTKKGREQLSTPIDPLNFVKFYNEGITLGLTGLQLLNERAQALIDAKEDVPLALVKMMIEAGTKLAMSQATIKAAGKPFGEPAVDENEGFRGGDEISPRFGSYRVRDVAGETRPVFDEGKADRDHYNERARQEGSPTIGGR